MIRLLLFRALLFAIPFALYALYLQLAKRRPGMNVPETPWFWLIVAGLLLVIASFVYVGLTEGETTAGVYVAPHVVNGKVVPGHVEPQKTP
jgi:drug/metabolite transporter (DMT)-like permease